MKEYKVTIDDEGTYRWYNKEGQRHRDEGPAVKFPNGKKYWYKDGKLHRDGDLPAEEHANGDKLWYQDDRLHRLKGPALILSDGTKAWYIKGTKYTEKKFNKKVKKLRSCFDKVIEIDGAKYKLVKA